MIWDSINIYRINYYVVVKNLCNYERVRKMEATIRDDYTKILADEQRKVRNLVLDGLEQIKEGKVKDFNTVCDRLEKKYTNASI